MTKKTYRVWHQVYLDVQNVLEEFDPIDEDELGDELRKYLDVLNRRLVAYEQKHLELATNRAQRRLSV